MAILKHSVHMAPALTFPLQEEAEQGCCRGDGLVVVVIVVDGEEVSLHVCVAHQQVHVGNAVNMLKEPVELIKLARLGPVQRKAPELCSKLYR